MNSYKEIVSVIAEFYKAQDNVPNLEVEGRIGCLSKKDEEDEDDSYHFDTNISELYYDKILKELKTCKNWTSRSYTFTTDYYHSNNKRYSERVVNEETTVECVKKRRIKNFNILSEDGILDLRLSFSVEEPCDAKDFAKVKDKCKLKREKKRHTFIRGDYKYDITEVLTDNGTNEVEVTYEYEVEYLHKKAKNHYETINKILYKLLDSLFICEDIKIDHDKVVKKLNLIK